MSQSQVGAANRAAHVEGLTNQAGANEVIGCIAYHGADGVWLGTAGHVSPNLQSLRLVPVSVEKAIRGQRGLTTGLVGQLDSLSCTFDFIMEGNVRNDALLSGGLPTHNCCVSIGSLPVLKIPPFTDALNAAASGFTIANNIVSIVSGNASTIVRPWIYRGEGEINGRSDDVYTGTITLHRFWGIEEWTSVT